MYTYSDHGKGDASRKLQRWARKYKIVDGQGDRLTLLNNWESIQSDIDKILGRDRSAGQLSDFASQFQAGHSQFAGLSPEQLVQVLTTITQADFANYSAADQELIKAILHLAGTMTDSSTSITTAVQGLYYPAPPSAQTLAQQFQAQYGGVIDSQPDQMSKLSLQVQLMQQQVTIWEAKAAEVARTQGYYSQEYVNLQDAISGFKQVIGSTGTFFGTLVNTGLVGEIAKLTILTAQYGEAKAEQLLALQEWYDAQKALIGTNATALDALKVVFDQKWADIIGGIASSDALTSAKERLADWWHNLFLDQTLSPLSPQEQLQTARSQYESTLALAQGGDVNAIGRLSGDADMYLKLAREIFASSNIYTAIFRDVAQATGSIAGISQTEINTRLYGALPTSGTLATSADIAALTASVNDLITMFGSGDAKVSDPDLADSIDNLASKLKAGAGALA